MISISAVPVQAKGYESVCHWLTVLNNYDSDCVTDIQLEKYNVSIEQVKMCFIIVICSLICCVGCL